MPGAGVPLPLAPDGRPDHQAAARARGGAAGGLLPLRHTRLQDQHQGQ